MTKINHVNLGKNSYDIVIDKDVCRNVGRAISPIYSGEKIAVITDETVFSLYGRTLMTGLISAGYNPKAIVLKPGEETKSLESLGYVLGELAKMQINRQDLLMAFGGGVIGDLCGFAAACYMRGVPYVQVPTTLLAQVDSSVGGKTAVNLPEGKNLVGAFWQPKMVVVDTDLLSSLDDRQFASGMAEVIKYGAIFDYEFFEKLAQNAPREKIMEIMPEVIYTCCDLKRKVVEKDEKDTGERMLLNFGHTFGHAIEKLGNYTKYTHGEGVAIGMCLAAKYGEGMGITPKGTADKIVDICKAYALPTDDGVDVSQIAEISKIDKKANDGQVNLVLLETLGNAKCVPTAFGKFSDNLKNIF